MKKVLWMIFMTFMVLNVNAQKSISSDEVINWADVAMVPWHSQPSTFSFRLSIKC